MTKQQIIDIIENAIVANNNNEITADVLRPVLVAMMSQINDLLGSLSDLDTTDKNTLVSALNEVFNNNNVGGGVTVLTGTADPNVTSPPVVSIGDFYNRTFGGNTIEFYIFNGLEWVQLPDTSSAVGTLGEIRQYDETDGSTLLIPNHVSVAIWVGGNTSNKFALPIASTSDKKEITLMNQSNAIMNTNTPYRALNGDSSVIIDVKSSMTIKSNGSEWIRIR